MKPLPWRTVLPVEETGRFTREQLENAVDIVIAQRRAYAAGRPMILRETGPEWGVAPPRPQAPAAPAEPVPYERPRRSRGRKRPEAGG